MEKLFVFGRDSRSCEKIIPLMNDLKGINFYFFSDIQILQNAFECIIPDAIICYETDLYLLRENLKFDATKFKLVVVSDSSSDVNVVDENAIFLPSDFSNTQIIDFLKAPEQQKRDLIFTVGMLDLIIQNIPIAMFWKDKNLRYVGCDKLFCKDCGLDENADVYGLNDFDLFPKEIAFKNLVTDQEVLDTGKPILNYQEKIINQDGSIDYLQKSKIPIKDNKGEVIMIMGLYEKITDRIILQEHLKNEKHYLQMLMDNIPDTIYFKDRDSKFIKINKAQAQTLGLNNPEDAIGKMDADFFDIEHSTQAFLDEQKLMREGVPLINKLEHINTAMGYKYVTATKIPLMDEAGNCIGMVGVSRDVTKQHQIEEELIHEKELMNLLMDNIPDRIYFKDKDSRFIRANRALAKLFGVDNPADLYGKSDFDFNEEKYAKQFYEDEQKLMRSGKPQINKIESHLRGNSLVWGMATKIPIYNKKNELFGLVGITRDFTAQKRLEDALEQEKDLLQILMDNIPDFIYFKDQDSKYVRINKAVAESLQVKDISEVYGKTDHDFFPKEYADIFLNHEKEIFETGKAIIGRIEKSSLLDGTPIWVSTTKMPIQDENGKIKGIVGISRNVTLEEMTKQSYLIAKEKAEEANKAKSLFLANMSHEIRTPMNGVIGMADILKRTQLDPVQNEYLDIIMKSGQSLLSIINDILDFSKIESGKMTLESAPICIRNIIEEVADIQIVHASDKSIDLFTFVDADMPEFVNGDYVRLKQIITNLVNNAIKFTAQGEVYVSAEYKGFKSKKHNILFKIKDSGIGIAKEDQKKLFQSFTQVDTSTTRRFGGTGLGLAICQRLVSEMGGKFSIESEEGKGSVFSFLAKFEPASEQQETSIQFKNVSFKNLNVLIVDDNQTNRKIFREYLEKWQMIVYEVTNGRDAIDTLTKFSEKNISIDIVLVDYQMAGMDGVELAKRIKANPSLSSSRLILLSSVTDAIQRDNLKSYGFEYYLNKPVKLKQLFNVIASVIGKLKQQTPSSNELDIDLELYRNKRFLIVEDNEINMKVAKFSLNMISNFVFSAYDGLEAIEIFKSENIDFILMDIQMPLLNGIEATHQIREMEKGLGVEKPVKIIAMTANTMREDVERCLEVGMNAFLGKPFRVSDLVNVLREIE